MTLNVCSVWMGISCGTTIAIKFEKKPRLKLGFWRHVAIFFYKYQISSAKCKTSKPVKSINQIRFLRPQLLKSIQLEFGNFKAVLLDLIRAYSAAIIESRVRAFDFTSSNAETL